MPITFTCPGCGERWRAPTSAAGRKTKCPKCRQTIRVPDTEAEAIALDVLKDVKPRSPHEPPTAEDIKPRSPHEPPAIEGTGHLFTKVAGVAGVALARLAHVGRLALRALAPAGARLAQGRTVQRIQRRRIVAVETVEGVEPRRLREPPAVEGLGHFFTKVAGVTFENEDGTPRQEIIADCRAHEMLVLDTEPDNPHDPDAVRVCRGDEDQTQIGYLPRHVASEVVERAEQGYRYGVFISAVTGGEEGRFYGVNLLIVEIEPGAAEADQIAYIKWALLHAE